MNERVLAVREYEIKMVTRSAVDRRGYRAKTRVYGAINTLSPELNRELERWTQIPVTDALRQSDPDEVNRIMEHYRRARRAVIGDARRGLTELLVHVSGDLNQDVRVSHFSSSAGCSCGCSPGFVLTACLRFEERPIDLFITCGDDVKETVK